MQYLVVRCIRDAESYSILIKGLDIRYTINPYSGAVCCSLLLLRAIVITIEIVFVL